VVVVEGVAVLGVVAAGAFGGLAVEDPHRARMSSAAAAVGRHARIPRMSVSRRLVQSFYSAGTQESFVRTNASAGAALDGASRAGIMRGAQERLDGRPSDHAAESSASRMAVYVGSSAAVLTSDWLRKAVSVRSLVGSCNT